MGEEQQGIEDKPEVHLSFPVSSPHDTDNPQDHWRLPQGTAHVPGQKFGKAGGGVGGSRENCGPAAN